MYIFFFFHLLSGFRGFPGAVPVSIASVDANIISNVLKLCSEALPQRCLFFFFCSLVAGLLTRGTGMGFPGRSTLATARAVEHAKSHKYAENANFKIK